MYFELSSSPRTKTGRRALRAIRVERAVTVAAVKKWDGGRCDCCESHISYTGEPILSIKEIVEGQSFAWVCSGLRW